MKWWQLNLDARRTFNIFTHKIANTISVRLTCTLYTQIFTYIHISMPFSLFHFQFCRIWMNMLSFFFLFFFRFHSVSFCLITTSVSACALECIYLCGCLMSVPWSMVDSLYSHIEYYLANAKLAVCSFPFTLWNLFIGENNMFEPFYIAYRLE